MENGHYEPDLVSMLQRRAGDIETNPGPVMTRRQSRSEEANHVNHGDPIVGELEESPSKDASHVQSQETKKIRTPMRVRKEGKLPRRRINTNRKKLTPPPTSSCSNPVCRKPFDGRSVIVTCESCNRQFHKLCGGNRWRMDSVVKNNTKWRCDDCRRNCANQATTTQPELETPTPETEGTQQQNTEEDQDKTVEPPVQIKHKCMHEECGKYLRARSGIFCSECKGGVHVQKNCSDMTRKQCDDIRSGKVKWKCDGCKGIIANPYPTPVEDTAVEYQMGKESKKKTNLKILQWNADAYLSKKEEFYHFVIENDIDIFFIQETKMTRKDKTPPIKGYEIRRRDREQPKGKENNRGGGLLFGIKDSIPFREINNKMRGPNDDITEWHTIEIPTEKKKQIRITNMYIPPIRTTASEQARMRKDQISTDRWPCRQDDIVIGDFNAHSSIWDDAVIEKPGLYDSRAEAIEEWLQMTEMLSLNTGETTRSSKHQESDTAPDISFVHAHQLDKFTWETLDMASSDHKPILITYKDGVEIPEVNTSPRYKWRLNKADWEKFKMQVEDKVPNDYKEMDIEKHEEKTREIIIEAANRHIGKKKITTENKAWLTPEIREAIKERNRLRKTLIDNREEWTEAGRKVSEMIKEEKTKRWKEYVESLDQQTTDKQLWRTIHNLEGKTHQGGKNETLIVNGKAYISDRDKANQFAKTYKSYSKLPARKEDRAIRRKFWKYIKEGRNIPMTEAEQDITMFELERAIEETGTNKAAGKDEIPYEFLRNLGTKAKLMILCLMNKCWQGENLPRQWRTAIIRTLLKDGKDPKETTSYRPISLTSCLGKVLEKIVADRLMHFMESRGLINDNQAGFRQNRATTDQVMKLVQSASDQLHKPKGQSKLTLCTFFDYEKAYDKVWRDGLLYKMIRLEIPWRYIRYVRFFLSTRQTVVNINGVASKMFTLNEGLPQGSAISPLLFLIFINDIDVDLHPDTLVSLFADDTAVWTQRGVDQEHSQRIMQEEIDKICEWARKWKMKLNEGKTKTVVISTKPSDTDWKPTLQLNGKSVDTVPSHKFLGVQIDNKLRFPEHIEETVRRCTKRVNVLKCLGGKDWGQSLESQRKVYLTLIRTCIEYASSSWWPWIADTAKKKLQRVQNAGLKAMASLASRCPTDFIHLETGIEPLCVRMEKNDLIMRDKYRRLPEDDERRRLLEKVAPVSLKTRYGWRHSTDFEKDLLSTATFKNTGIRIKPWETFANVKLQKVQLEKKKAEYQPLELQTISNQQIAEVDADFYIFTDGSTSGNQEKGGAGVCVEDSKGHPVAEFRQPAGARCSSYGGECVAMHTAATWIESKEIESERSVSFMILTDSESLVNSLANKTWKVKDEWLLRVKDTLTRINSQVTIMWIPSHCGIEGNERADQLANAGALMSQDDIPVTHAITKAKIKARKWQIEHPRAKAMYGERRRPREEIEKRWPRSVRTLYGRLRTGHAKELNYYQHKLHNIDSPNCEVCNEIESIEHVLTKCPTLSGARAKHWPTDVDVSMLVTHPEVCRQILAHRFPKLKYRNKDETNPRMNAPNEEGNQSL